MNRLVRLLMIGLALVVAFSTAGVTAAQAAVVPVHGSVYDGFTNDPLEGASVSVWPDYSTALDPTGTALAEDTADAAGEFDLANLEDGSTYWLRSTAAGYTTQVQEFVVDGDAPFLDTIYLYPQQGGVHGTILDHDGDPYADGCTTVEFYDASGTGDEPIDQTEADDDGTFSERYLRVGDYKVRAYDDCNDDLPAVWSGGTDFDSATTYTVTVGGDTLIAPITLSPGASIKGQVVDPEGDPLGQVLVESFASDPFDPAEPSEPTARVYTDASGHYTLRGQQPGNYKVRFTDPTAEYTREWFDDAATFDTATEVVVTDDTDVTVDTAELAPVTPDDSAKLLTGKVTDVNGTPLAGITVTAFGPTEANTVTKRDGTYSFPAIDLQSTEDSYPYYLQFRDDLGDGPGGAERFLEQYYVGAVSYRQATPVEVTSTLQTLKTVKLVGYGSITGTVATSSEYPRRDVDVEVYNRDGELVKQDRTSTVGTYSVGRLKPGTYKVRFSGGASGGDGYYPLVGQWYKGKYSFAAATSVTVKDLGTTTGVGVTMTNQLTAVTAPRISGTAKKGKTLKASTGTWSHVSDTTYQYQWYRGSSRISGATKSSYKLGSKDVGKKIKVEVTASDIYDTYRDGEKTSSSTSTVKK